MKCVLGFDGGGTKTECVVLNEAGAVVARGKGPASNPTRIGFPAAFAAIKETTRTANNSTRISLEVAALCAGLAGTGRPENRDQMLHFLKEQFPEAIVDVRPDFELPLYAMPPGAAMVLIVGTGSAAVARGGAGSIKRQGGFGPASSDEGSAFDIGLAAIAASRTAGNCGFSHRGAFSSIGRTRAPNLAPSRLYELGGSRFESRRQRGRRLPSRISCRCRRR